MNAILAIFKKEIKRFFTDKRLLLSLLLPGLIIYFVYSIMGSFMGDMLSPTGVNYQVVVYNQSDNQEALNNPPELQITVTKKSGEVSNEDIQKLIISHEPLNINWAFNIHGHDHNKNNKGDIFHLNIASNVVDYNYYDLSKIIKSGALKNIKSIHRITIDNASNKN